MRLPAGEVLIVAAAVADAGPDELMGRAAKAMAAAGCVFTGQIASAPRGEDLDRWGRAPGLEEELVRGAPERAAAQVAERGRHAVRTGWSRRGGGPMALSVLRPPEPEPLLVDLVMAAGALGLEPGPVRAASARTPAAAGASPSDCCAPSRRARAHSTRGPVRR